MGFTIIIDGTNFIFELNRHGKDIDYILNTLSFPHLHAIIQEELLNVGLAGMPFYHTEFICSKKLLGNLTSKDTEKVIKKLKRERGVVVNRIILEKRSKQEKAVDMTVFSRMLAMGEKNWDHIVLITDDRDFVPAIKELMNKKIHVVLVGFDDGKYPLDLINESFLFLDLGKLLTEMERRLLAAKT